MMMRVIDLLKMVISVTFISFFYIFLLKALLYYYRFIVLNKNYKLKTIYNKTLFPSFSHMNSNAETLNTLTSHVSSLASQHLRFFPTPCSVFPKSKFLRPHPSVSPSFPLFSHTNSDAETLNTLASHVSSLASQHLRFFPTPFPFSPNPNSSIFPQNPLL